MSLPANGINQIIPFSELDFIDKFEPLVCFIYYLETDLVFVVVPLPSLLNA